MNFTENQMRDPWGWCQSVFESNGWTTKMIADAVAAPWSTVRGLMNGTNDAPRYDLLKRMITVAI